MDILDNLKYSKHILPKQERQPSVTDNIKRLKADLLENIISTKREVEELMNRLDKLLVRFSAHEDKLKGTE